MRRIKWFLIIILLLSSSLPAREARAVVEHSKKDVFYPNLEALIKQEFNLTVQKKAYANLESFFGALKKIQKQTKNRSEIYFDVFSFKTSGKKYLWLFENLEQQHGKLIVVNTDLNVLYFSEEVGHFKKVQVSDLFQVGEQNFQVTFVMNKAKSTWDITQIFRLDKLNTMEMMYQYSPTGLMKLDSFSSESKSLSGEVRNIWDRGVLRCESLLVWAKRTKNHSPELNLVSTAFLDIDIKNLNPEKLKELNTVSRKKFSILPGQKNSVILDRIALDGEMPAYFVSYGVKYGDDPPFGKSPCPSGWLPKKEPPPPIGN